VTKLLEPADEDVGTTVHLVPHFHFDPVWWNTQAAATSELGAAGWARSDWSASPRMRFQGSAFDVLRSHLAHAVGDADYRFCVAEVDYLEPFWTRHPEHRGLIAELLAVERLEVVGGTYNEPSTNLTTPALTRRNLDEGLEVQRGVLGATVTTAWQLDVFGHDPAFPALLADAGLDAAVLARGPYGPWGPMLDGGFAPPHAPDGVAFPTEFAWLGPRGGEVLGVYLAAHYSTAYRLDEAMTWEEAANAVIVLGRQLRSVSATGHVVVLVGTDVSPPARWVTEVPRRLAGCRDWPRVSCSLPRHAIAAIRAELAATGRVLRPQTRDFNPVYTGKDVSYVDTKQAQRAIEHLAADVEQLVGPSPGLDDAWRLLVFGAHHDAITGTESDQVYLDLLAGWRHAHDLAAAALDAAVAVPPAPADAVPIVLANAVDRPRADVARVELGRDRLAPLRAVGLRVVASLDGGDEIPFVVDAIDRDGDVIVGAVLSIRVADLAPSASTTVWLVAGDDVPRWEPVEGVSAGNEHHRMTLDPSRGGGVASWRSADGTELIADGGLGGVLVLVDEHPTHPDAGEGPWHLLPRAVAARSSDAPAAVRAERSPLGERLCVSGRLGTAPFRTVLTVWRHLDRIDVTVDLDAVDGADHLVRVEWPVPVAGAMPVVDTGAGPIGRGFALLGVDAAEHPWSLETPALGWFGASVTCRVDIADGTATRSRAIAVAEVITPSDSPADLDRARRLVVALGGAGVTATTTVATGPRTGALGLDSNAPDVRIALGGPVDAGAAAAGVIASELARRGAARVWLRPRRPLRDVWVPGLDVRGLDDLPTLLVLGDGEAALDAEVDAVVDELAGFRIGALDGGGPGAAGERVDDRTVAVVNRGTPSCGVTVDGTLVTTVLRACSAWPSGQWIDPPQRRAPDGSSFQLQRWSHRFELSLVARSGDWRTAGIDRVADDVNRPVRATAGGPAAAGEAATAGEAAPAPTFSRHWVQGRGPAPRPGPAVTVHLHPPPDAALTRGCGRWRVTLASNAARPVTAHVEVSVPDGWQATASSWTIDVAAGGWAEAELVVAAPTTSPGHHVVRVVATAEGTAGYDEHVVTVGADAAPLELGRHLPDVDLVAGRAVDVAASVINRCDRDLWAEVDVVSPWGSWPLVTPARRRVTLPAAAVTTLPLRFAAPLDHPQGEWWWLLRAVAGPLVAYSPSAQIAVTR